METHISSQIFMVRIFEKCLWQKWKKWLNRKDLNFVYKHRHKAFQFGETLFDLQTKVNLAFLDTIKKVKKDVICLNLDELGFNSDQTPMEIYLWENNFMYTYFSQSPNTSRVDLCFWTSLRRLDPSLSSQDSMQRCICWLQSKCEPFENDTKLPLNNKEGRGPNVQQKASNSPKA